MNLKQCKKARNHFRRILPSLSEVVYDVINEHQRTFVYPAGTSIPEAGGMHKVLLPVDPEKNEPVPMVIAVDVHQRILGKCQRRYYKMMKDDYKRMKRGLPSRNRGTT